MSQGILKTYFRVMVKPVAILCIFFALVGMVSLTYWPNMRPDPSFTQEMRIKEQERLSNPLFLITSLFTGNFGYSSSTRSLVSEELAQRWPNTLLLVGVSIITTALVGFGLSFLFRPRQQKPQVYAHSLRNFLFGSAFIVAILLLWIFVFQAYSTFGSTWFPMRGLFSIPEPTDPGSRAIDMLRHLVLPVFTLTLVGTLRTLLILWSSGTPFADKSRLKRSIYPITTIDFALFISAAVLVEYVFTLPGLGNMLIGRLMSADFNAALAAFALLLALGVGLGVLSTLLDFVQIFFGLRQSLEQEANLESKAIEQAGRGSLTFVKALWRRKSLIIGGAILVCFALSAVLAPMVAPYDPSTQVADTFAPPSWMEAFAPGRGHGIFGTDYLGRDVFSQVAYAAGAVLSAVLPISLLAAAVGSAIGFLAGYFQSWVDNLIMVFTDAVAWIPVLPFLLTFSYTFGRNVLFFLVPSLWFLLGITVTASRNVYIRRSKGRKLRGTALKGKLISVSKQFCANLCLITASVILLLTAIDSLGLGDPQVVTWGRMVCYAFGFGALQNLAWWSFLAPMLSIILLTLALFLVGYGLDDD